MRDITGSLVETIIHFVGNLLRFIGVRESFVLGSERTITILCLFLFSLLLTFFLNRWVAPILRRIVSKTSTKWDDLLLNRKVIRALCNLIPPLLLVQLAPHLSEKGTLPQILEIVYQMYMLLAIFFVAIAIIDAAHDIWDQFESLRDKPIKGYVQVLKIITYIITGIVLLSIFIGKPPYVLLTGLGASAAILSLVFKDTLSGLVAGIQLSANDMLRKGDWITVPKHNINGVVEEISLVTVKVRNFDETMCTVPPYVLVSESFQNWRTMKEKGARRIARSLFVDIQSVNFLSQDELKALPAYPILCDMCHHIVLNEEEKCVIKESPSECLELYIQKSRLVNLTLFRLFLKRYLEQHTMVAEELFNTVRELPSTGMGIPVELYFFVSDTDWGNYESIQADIMDYVMAIIPFFGLQLYQQPSSNDIRSLKS